MSDLREKLESAKSGAESLYAFCEGEWYQDLAKAIRDTLADVIKVLNPSLDENGLARCGCGGRLALHKMPESNYDSVEDKPVFFVNCSNDDCSLFFGYYHFAEDAIKAANRAMGVKGADE